MSNSVFVIAEAGVNHNGNRGLAFQLIDVATKAGANAVKFQTFRAGDLVTKHAAKAKYQQKVTNNKESQFDMLKKLELSREDHLELVAYCKTKNIKFLSTAFDTVSLEFLVNELGLTILKIPSGEITNGPLLLAHAEKRCDLIMSTGMATLDEIEEALGVLAFGLIGAESPSRSAFREAYQSDEGRQALKQRVTLLHCTTEYPAPLHDINLNAMRTMHDTFGLKVGYSDHSEGIIVPIAAASMGAVLIEKHVTLDKSLPGPDHKASLDPHELNNMIESIRMVEKIMGDGKKVPRESEIKNRDIARRSIVAAKDISQGDVFTEDNLSIKRPGVGKSPMEYWEYLGDKSTRFYREEELIL